MACRAGRARELARGVPWDSGQSLSRHDVSPARTAAVLCYHPSKKPGILLAIRLLPTAYHHENKLSPQRRSSLDLTAKAQAAAVHLNGSPGLTPRHCTCAPAMLCKLTKHTRPSPRHAPRQAKTAGDILRSPGWQLLMPGDTTASGFTLPIREGQGSHLIPHRLSLCKGVL